MIIETLQIIECIPIKNFKHKIETTKKHIGTAKVEIINNEYIYIEKWRANENQLQAR